MDKEINNVWDSWNIYTGDLWILFSAWVILECCIICNALLFHH